MSSRSSTGEPAVAGGGAEAWGALVIVGVIVAEMLGVADGLGFLITRHRTLLNSPEFMRVSCSCSR